MPDPVTIPDAHARPGAEPVARAAALRHREFAGRAPSIIAVAPGRVNLIGEHVDYAGGLVLPLAIDRWTALAASPAPGPNHRVFAADLGETASFDARAPLDAAAIRAALPHWATYVAGVFEQLRRLANHRGLPASGACGPLDLTITTSVPLGAGLSSSAALELSVAHALASVLRLDLSPLEFARLARRAEHEFAGAPCGIMDQFISASAHAESALLIDCRDETTTPVPLPDGLAVVVVDSGVKHSVPDGLYAEKVDAAKSALQTFGSLRPNVDTGEPFPLALTPQSPLPPEPVRRAVDHIRFENARVVAFAAALSSGDLPHAGQCLLQSHGSLRDVLQVSCPEVDELVAHAASLPGVYGARMTGAGFGGCIVALTTPAAAETVAATLARPTSRIAARVLPVSGACVARCI